MDGSEFAGCVDVDGRFGEHFSEGDESETVIGECG